MKIVTEVFFTQMHGGSYEINKRMMASAVLCGLEIKQVTDFMETFDIACPKATSLYQAEVDLFPVIMTHGDAETKNQIARANDLPNGPVIAVDEQHSRSQRAGKRAPYCSAAFINEANGKIITLSHASKAEADKLKVKDLAKASRLLGLSTVAREINKIDMLVFDGCTSAQKDVNERVQCDRRHAGVKLNKDLWHKAKSLGKDWKKLINTKASRGVLMYPNLANITPFMMKLHWTYCARNCKKNVDLFEQLWLERAYYWNIDMNISEHGEEFAALYNFLEHYLPDIPSYIYAKYTSKTESFHHVANKYCSKGAARSNEAYKARKTLALLDWNENHGKDKITSMFRQKIMIDFIGQC